MKFRLRKTGILKNAIDYYFKSVNRHSSRKNSNLIALMMKTSQKDPETYSVELHITATVPHPQQVEEEEYFLDQL